MNPKSFELLNNLTFCVFDLETTGGNQNQDKIIEIGLVKIHQLKIIEEKSYLINPELAIPEFIQKLTSIKESDVEKCPTIDEVIDEILVFMGDSILVAHNTSFDIPFFNSVLKRLGKTELSNKAICTNLMTKYMIPNLLSSNLNYMSKIFDLHHQKAHRALDDARATAELLLKYLSIFISKDIQKVNNLYYPKNKFELDRIHFKKSIDKKTVIEQIKSIQNPFLTIFKGMEGLVLYSFPSNGSKNEFLYLEKKINEIDYETITIKLAGPYLQGFIEASSFYLKLSETYKEEFIQKIIEFNNIDAKDINSEAIENPCDFFIINHIVPEQLVIFMTETIHQKQELVFRHPTHHNKLIQFINSKTQRLISKKYRSDQLPLKLKNLFYLYLIQKNDSFKIFKSNQKVTYNDLKKDFEHFIANNENTYKFPKNFL